MKLEKHLPTFFKYTSMLAPSLAASIALDFFATARRVPRPKSEMGFYETSKKYFLKNKIAVFEWGSENQEIVFLIHGWNGRGTQIAAFAEDLIKKNYRVIALDGPAHGSSPGKKTNPSEYADFIVNAQKELAPSGVKAVIAHSFGGGCSALALERGLKTKSLILIGSPAHYDKVVDHFCKQIMLSKKATKIFFSKIEKLTGIKPKDLSTGKVIAPFNIPGLVVHDHDDDAVKFTSAESIVKEWPKARLIETSGLGHRRILKNPEVIRQVVDFILGIP